MTDESTPKPRGFAALTPEQRQEIGSKGGKTSQARFTANRFTSRTAAEAGKKAQANGNAHKWTSEEAREAGRKGGAAKRKTKDLPA